MRYLILFLLLPFTMAALPPSCTPRHQRLGPPTPYCSAPEEVAVVSVWILHCIEKANPKSDEDPEDWVKQCQRTAEEIHCTDYPTFRRRGHWVPCPLAVTPAERNGCGVVPSTRESL